MLALFSIIVRKSMYGRVHEAKKKKKKKSVHAAKRGCFGHKVRGGM
jgi:hypothetical protein